MGGEGGQFEAANMGRSVSFILKLPVVLLHLGLPQESCLWDPCGNKKSC